MRRPLVALAVAVGVVLTGGLAAAVIVVEPRTQPARTVAVQPPAPAPVAVSAAPLGGPAIAAPPTAAPPQSEAPSAVVAPTQASDAAPAHALDALRTGTLGIRATVTPACLHPGDRAVARIEAVPGAHVSLVVAYADGKSHGTMYAGPADPNGAIEFPFLVPDEAAIGEGKLMGAGYDPATDQRGTNAAAFMVKKGSSC